MRKLFFLLLFLPLIGIGQPTAKNVLSSTRYFSKNDKAVEFDKALANHAQTYHMGDFHWRVWSVTSGPDAGAYMVSEGPSDWTTLDGRGDINPAHKADWEKNVLPLVATTGARMYLTFQPDMSTVQLTDYADKIMITHMTAKPGKLPAVTDLIKKMKKVWEAGKESVAVYSVTASGEPGYVLVNRLREGLKELADGFRKPMSERFNDAYGAGMWESFYLKDYAEAVQTRWSELLVYKPELSSK